MSLSIIQTERKLENLIELMKLCAAQPASLPPLKILEQKAIAPLRGALTETSTKTTHQWNLQSPTTCVHVHPFKPLRLRILIDTLILFCTDF